MASTRPLFACVELGVDRRRLREQGHGLVTPVSGEEAGGILAARREVWPQRCPAVVPDGLDERRRITIDEPPTPQRGADRALGRRPACPLLEVADDRAATSWRPTANANWTSSTPCQRCPGKYRRWAVASQHAAATPNASSTRPFTRRSSACAMTSQSVPSPVPPAAPSPPPAARWTAAASRSPRWQATSARMALIMAPARVLCRAATARPRHRRWHRPTGRRGTGRSS